MRAIDHGLAALAALAAAPLAAGVLAARPALRVGVRERLGRLMVVPPGSIWVHAASVGEILAASRLIDRLRRESHDVFASTFTLSGRNVMRQTRPEVPCQLAPLDHPWCVDAALDRVQPAMLVLVEAELWPTWIASAARRSVPVVLVSGRISDRSFDRYRRLGGIVGRTLRRLTAIGARTPTDADHFRELGADPARVSVTGDLKIDFDAARRPLAPDIDRAVGKTRLFVAGSTHPGEEAAALLALEAVERAGLEAALILAPRHTERASEVERAVRLAGRRIRRRDELEGAPLLRGDVLVLDTVGELSALYARADVAFVGGSMVPVGGHNIVEPVFAGRPVVFGRHTDNVSHAVEILEECGAGRRVADAEDLGRVVVEILARPEEADRAAELGRQALSGHRGSSERAAELIQRVLAVGGDASP